MKNLIVIVFTVIAVMLSTNACKKGDIGPQKGPQGTQGVQGVQGPTGNANVHSYSFHATTSNWVLSEPNYTVNLKCPFITQSILDNGAVLVYMDNGSGALLSLPFTLWYKGFGHLTNQVVSLGFVRIWVSDSDLTQTDNPGDMTFKVVTIEGSANKNKLINIDLNNYQEVVKCFNLNN